MGACLTPFIVKQHDNIPVPCGKCPECKARRISGWSFRLMNEFKRASSGYFITLTYDTKHVPISRNGFMELRKRDVQLFFKRLRKAHTAADTFNNPIKYYAAGEYGGKTKRPHYHIILFNAKLELIQPSWDLGQIHYGEVNEASVGYTLKYISKMSKFPMHRNDDRQPEFSLMSKRLGFNYLTPQMIKWHNDDPNNRMYCNIEDGKKISMPRYYKEKIYDEHTRIMAGKHQLNIMQQQEAENIAKYGLEKWEWMKEQHRQAKFHKAEYQASQNRNKI